MEKDLPIRLAQNQDLPKLIDHLKRTIDESGVGQNPIFSPIETWPHDEVSFIQRRTIDMEKPISDCGWVREFILVTADQMIVGNVTLSHSPPLSACLHRATLGMGIESKFQGSGFGKRLLRFAIDYAKAQKTLQWIDLYVFEHNERALNLYKGFHFEVNGKREDYFKIKGKSATDISMSLKL